MEDSLSEYEARNEIFALVNDESWSGGLSLNSSLLAQ